MRRHTILSAVVAVVASLPLAAGADGFRCGNDLVRNGDSVLDVTDACGEPDRKVRLVGEDDQFVGHAYYYRLTNQFDRKITFHGGQVVRVESLN